MRFITISGSTYEVDQDNKKIRRLKGKADPTPRQGQDGEWREYINLSPIKIGEAVLIQWADAHVLTDAAKAFLGIENDRPERGRLTHTSMVMEIQDVPVDKPN
jgi:hypothetical protein